jgi:hypothetical protein
MKRFVIFGDIEFLYDNTALVHRVISAEHIADGDIEARAAELHNCDFVVPHYSDYSIKFMQYHEELGE